MSNTALHTVTGFACRLKEGTVVFRLVLAGMKGFYRLCRFSGRFSV